MAYKEGPPMYQNIDNRKGQAFGPTELTLLEAAHLGRCVITDVNKAFD
jgi:hypothetical protein